MDNNELHSKEDVLARCGLDAEKIVIIHVLMRTKGNQAQAAELLGTTRRILAYKVHKYEIDCTQFE